MEKLIIEKDGKINTKCKISEYECQLINDMFLNKRSFILVSNLLRLIELDKIENPTKEQRWEKLSRWRVLEIYFQLRKDETVKDRMWGIKYLKKKYGGKLLIQ